jgi:GNAT superfamily N-acetyltransferase
MRFAPVMIGLGPRSMIRAARWREAWAARDPRELHWHLGPIAVDAHLQQRGIGSRLMEEFCTLADRDGAMAYLETDKAENVVFYRRFGFETVGQAEVVGTPNWFMRRPAGAAVSASTAAADPR